MSQYRKHTRVVLVLCVKCTFGCISVRTQKLSHTDQELPTKLNVLIENLASKLSVLTGVAIVVLTVVTSWT